MVSCELSLQYSSPSDQSTIDLHFAPLALRGLVQSLSQVTPPYAFMMHTSWGSLVRWLGN
eukprot:1984058-Pyramimonas_sp.AAC.1